MPMFRGTARSIVKLLLLLLIPAIGLWYAEARRTSDTLVIGQRFPSIPLEHILGTPSLPGSTGRPTVVVVFSASCHFCEEQLVRIDTLIRLFGEQIDFLTVSTSDASETQQLLSTIPHLSNVACAHRENTWAMWRVRTVPSVFLTDHRGVLVAHWSGLKDVEEERLLIERLAQQSIRPRR